MKHFHPAAFDIIRGKSLNDPGCCLPILRLHIVRECGFRFKSLFIMFTSCQVKQTDLFWSLSLQPGEQEFTEKKVVPVPMTLGVQAGQEKVLLHELIQHGLGVPDTRQGIARGSIHLGQDGCASKEGLFILRLPAKDFLCKVVENEPVGTAQPSYKTVSASGILTLQRGTYDLQGCRPALGFLHQHAQALLGEPGDGGVDHRGDLIFAEAQLGGSQFCQHAACPHSSQCQGGVCAGGKDNVQRSRAILQEQVHQLVNDRARNEVVVFQDQQPRVQQIFG